MFAAAATVLAATLASSHGAPAVAGSDAIAKAPAAELRLGRDFILKLAANPAPASGVRQLQAALEPGALAAPLRELGNGWYVMRTETALSRADMQGAAARLRAQPGVLMAAADAQEPRAATPRLPNDTLYPQQWWLGALDAASAGVPDMPQAWSRSTGFPAAGLGPVVAVLDTGIVGHPETDAHLVLPGYDFVSNPTYAGDSDGRDSDPTDPGDRLTQAEKAADPATWDGCAVAEVSTWHGTLVAGQIAATSNNAAGVAAMNWNGRILPVRVAGRCGASVTDLVDGMRWAAGLSVAGVPPNTNPARIIVIGFAGFEPCDTAHPDPNVAAAAQLYTDTLAAVRATGALVVAAAGNERGPVGRPASCRGAFAVTALNRQGFKANYANYGSQVALATVGGDQDRQATCDTQLADSGVVSTSNLGTGAAQGFGYAAGSGTSFAAPVVAGAASLMWSLNPALSLDQIEAGLRASARPHAVVAALGACNAASNPGRCQCTSTTCGAGMLDADQALAYAADPRAYVAPVRTAVSLTSTALTQCATLLGLPPVAVTPPASTPASSPASTPPVTGTPAPSSGGGGGGGALGFGWLLGLAVAIAALRRAERKDCTPP